MSSNDIKKMKFKAPDNEENTSGLTPDLKKLLVVRNSAEKSDYDEDMDNKETDTYIIYIKDYDESILPENDPAKVYEEVKELLPRATLAKPVGGNTVNVTFDRKVYFENALNQNFHSFGLSTRIEGKNEPENRVVIRNMHAATSLETIKKYLEWENVKVTKMKWLQKRKRKVYIVSF